MEVALALHVEATEDPALKPLHRGHVAALTRAAAVLSGPVPLILRAFARQSRSARRAAALSTLAGSLLTRVAWIAAGKASARQEATSSARVDAPLA